MAAKGWRKRNTHIPDATKMVEGVKDSLTTQQEHGPVAYAIGDEMFWHTDPALNDYIRENGEALYTAPQPKQMTDEDFLDWYDSAVWGNEDFKDSCWMAFEAGWKAAHGIKENT